MQQSQAAPTAYAVPGTPGLPGKPRSIGVAILLAIVTLGIYAVVWVYKTHSEIKSASGLGVGGGLGLVIYLFANPVTYFLLPSEVGKMYNAAGRPNPVSGQTGFWLLLPGVGQLVWFIKVQGALNRFWTSRGQG